jgi:hypothetical protein
MCTAGLDDGVGTLKIAQRSYRISRYKVRHAVEIERYLDSMRPDPLATIGPVLERLSVTQQQVLLGRMYDDLVRSHRGSSQGVDDYLDTAEGMGHAIWLCIREHQPEVHRDELISALKELSPVEFARTTEQAFREMGLIEGNWPGQVQAESG